MNKFTLLESGLFMSKKTPFKIYDHRQILFYSSDFVKNFKGVFSLPKGVYYSDNEIFKISQLKDNFNSFKLPKRERDLKHNFDIFKIYFSNNPSKCTINHIDKTINFDKSFKDKPLYILHFVLSHEMGHNYYKTEEYADLYAVKQMLKMGYNPSQIGLCPLLSLSKHSDYRKNIIVKQILKYYKK